MKIDWKLKGSNLLRFGCGKDTVVHPETCSDVVLMGHNGSQSLTDWITKDQTNPSLGSSLTDWITNIFIKTVDDETQFIINAAYTPTADWSENGFLLGTLNETTQIWLPYGSASSYGVFKVGNGLSVSNDGMLTIGAATNTYFGGFKTGFTPSESIPNGIPVQLDSNNRAYVDVLGGITTESIIYRWDEHNLTHITTALNPSAYIVSEGADSFSTLNIATYINTFKDLFNTSINPGRLYPVRADIEGHLYTFVPWTDTSYNVYNNTSTVGAGLVPYSNDTSINSTAFLGKDGTWKVPSYNNLLNKPTVFSSSVDGFVPKASNSGDNNKFLKGDGSWAIPTNTTYELASEDNPKGLLSVYDQITNATGCTVVATAATPTIIAPVRYDEDNKIHGVVLDDFMEDTNFLKALATALAPIIENDASLKAAWQAALA